MSDHDHEHAPGTPAHEHDDVMEIFPGEALKARFYREDGSYITVHVRDGELRACGSRPIAAERRKADVIGLTFIASDDCDAWR